MLTTPNLSFDQLPTVVAKLLVEFEKQSDLLHQLVAERPAVDEPFISISEASQIIKKAVPTIYFLAANKKLPAHKQGRQWYFLRSELVAWIKSGQN